MRIQGYEGREETITENHRTSEIMNLLLSKDGKFCGQVKQFSDSLKGLSTHDASYAIWKTLRDNVKYKPDSEALQQLKSPARLVYDGQGDCKSYSLFAAAVLKNLGIPYQFRFVSFERDDATPTHVYIVADPKGDKTIIDAVLSTFNYEKPYKHKQDRPMLNMLTGIEQSSYLRHYKFERKGQGIGRNNPDGSAPTVTTGKYNGPRNAHFAPEQAIQNEIDFNALADLQKQKEAIAYNPSSDYATTKKQIKKIQDQQDGYINALLDYYKEAQSMAGDSVAVSIVKGVQQIIANAVYPGAGIILVGLEKMIQKSKDDGDKTWLQSIKKYTSDSFSFSVDDYNENYNPNSATNKLLALKGASKGSGANALANSVVTQAFNSGSLQTATQAQNTSSAIAPPINSATKLSVLKKQVVNPTINPGGNKGGKFNPPAQAGMSTTTKVILALLTSGAVYEYVQTN